MAQPERYAAVELGGMQIRVAVAEGNVENIVIRKTFKTGTVPKDTMALIVEWLQEQFDQAPFKALGIASFGPIDPRINSPTFGQITSTPKIAWRNFNVFEALDVFKVPVKFDTDVNAPAMYEYMYANSKAKTDADKISSCAYITVGTGIGIGLVVNDQPVHGMLHPEGGHMPYPSRNGDPFKGLEGWDIPQGIEANASALALAARAGLDHTDGLQKLGDDHPVWIDAAHFIAGACVNLVLLASPEKIVLGGGVLNRQCLFRMIRKEVQRMLNGYIATAQVTTDIDSFIVPAVHTGDAGIIGALALSVQAASDEGKRSENVSTTTSSDSNSTNQLFVGALLGASFALVMQKVLAKY